MELMTMLSLWRPGPMPTAFLGRFAPQIHSSPRREAISLSGARNCPLLSAGGTPDSMASNFSVESPRMNDKFLVHPAIA
jgi:hypothetical protein